jgi:beta-N-acetylhexosaminidase
MPTTLAVAVAALASAAANASAPAPDPTAGLSTRQLAGQRVVAGFSGTTAPASLLRRIHRGELGGVIVFTANISSRAQVRALTSSLQRARPRGAPPLIVAIDQEGGLVKRLAGAPALSAAQMGARDDPAVARAQGLGAARNISGVGVNVDLAPVLDVGRPGSIMRRQQRSFSGDAARVARIGGAFAAGLAQGHVAATGKHFPGLGAATLDQDVTPNRITLPLARLRAVDERPFSALAAKLPLVMVSSAIYPALSGRPAVFSRHVVTDELRGRVGFGGVSISDALDAAAMSRYGSPGRRALLAAQAGVDLLLFSDTSTGGAAAEEALVSAVQGGTLPEAALRDSARRTLELRATLRP